jgi:carboxymethylenebutenolidase
MPHRDVLIAAGDGTCDASLHTPSGSGPWPAVIMYPDAGFHGGQIASTAPDSPHVLAGSMRATLYIAGAEDDASFDDEQFERMSRALVDANVDHTLVTYPAAHGFAVPDNPTYDEAASARHWEALEELYASTLGT